MLMYIATLQSVSKNKNIRKPPLNLIIKKKLHPITAQIVNGQFSCIILVN